MCLIINKNYAKPVNGSIRYKVVYKAAPVEEFAFGARAEYISQYQRHPYALNRTEIKESRSKDVDLRGFHVFARLEDARNYCGPRRKILKCICKRFVAGGQWSDNPFVINEIWREVTPIEEIK